MNHCELNCLRPAESANEAHVRCEKETALTQTSSKVSEFLEQSEINPLSYTTLQNRENVNEKSVRHLNCTGVTQLDLRNIFDKFPNLESLTVDSCPNAQIYLPTSAPRLKTVVFQNLFTAEWPTLAKTSTLSLPALQHLKVTNCVKFDLYALTFWMQFARPTLRTIELNQLPKLYKNSMSELREEVEQRSKHHLPIPNIVVTDTRIAPYSPIRGMNPSEDEAYAIEAERLQETLETAKKTATAEKDLQPLLQPDAYRQDWIAIKRATRLAPK